MLGLQRLGEGRWLMGSIMWRGEKARGKIIHFQNKLPWNLSKKLIAASVSEYFPQFKIKQCNLLPQNVWWPLITFLNTVTYLYMEIRTGTFSQAGWGRHLLFHWPHWLLGLSHFFVANHGQCWLEGGGPEGRLFLSGFPLVTPWLYKSTMPGHQFQSELGIPTHTPGTLCTGLPESKALLWKSSYLGPGRNLPSDKLGPSGIFAYLIPIHTTWWWLRHWGGYFV